DRGGRPRCVGACPRLGQAGHRRHAGRRGPSAGVSVHDGVQVATCRGPAARCARSSPGRADSATKEVAMTTVAPEGVRSQRGTLLVDLSLEITNGMPAHSFFPSPVWLPYVTHAQSASAGLGEPGDPMTYAVSYLATLEHVGTHVDAPAHIKDGGDPVDKIPLDWFTGKAVCLDLRHVGDLGDIDVADLERAEEQSGV